MSFSVVACQPGVREGLYSSVDRIGQLDGPVGPYREQRWLIPYSAREAAMAATLWLPKGNGPFPLVVINHASSQDPDDRIEDPTSLYKTVALWFVRHGYAVVLPIRLGHGLTGGHYLEDQGGCHDADYVRAGRMTAVSIEAAINYMTSQPFIKKDGVVLVGQSAGGWGSLALASMNPSSVRAVVAFSPGRGGRMNGHAGQNCAPDQLVGAAGDFGREARVPVLWLNAQNDSYFGPELSQRMVDAFRGGGAKVEFHQLPPVGDDGHFMFRHAEAVGKWAPLVESFLSKSS